MIEYYQRLKIFTDNKKMIEVHNAGNHSFTSEPMSAINMKFYYKATIYLHNA